ncbi:MAG: dicarboxylate/amino acid:cation symporter [Planctomycetes bacterium]|nr:dicarboxylate/amino acid:cation symporter [Planctomycetota bacterium]
MHAVRANHWLILAGLVMGAACGAVAHRVVDRVPEWQRTLDFINTSILNPIGQIFLRLLFLVVVPLVFASLAAGVARLGDPGRLGRVAGRALVLFAITSTTATMIGLFAMNILQPGVGFDPIIRGELMEAFGAEAVRIEEGGSLGGDRALPVVMQVIDATLPRNILGAVVQMQMLPLIAFSLLLGVALGVQPSERRLRAVEFFDIIGDAMVFIVSVAMRLAPIAVFCLIFVVVARFGGELLWKLAQYVAVVLVCYAIVILLLYPLLLTVLARRNPWHVLRACVPVMVTAFSTSSSNATLPTTMQFSQRDLGVRREVSGFVLPLGATINMNGTALFEGCAVLFIAQVFGINLSLSDQILVLVLCVISSVGVAGVPGGSLPLLMAVMAQVGVPPTGIALILGVDRLLDMGRTAVNVMGDVVAAVCVEESMRRSDQSITTSA